MKQKYIYIHFFGGEGVGGVEGTGLGGKGGQRFNWFATQIACTLNLFLFPPLIL